ncbi:MAG: leucine-rich repeat domain-containing protein, partial [Ruminococcus sp.]|nr:leucine-rich repeat domain-containing protein [Ruminococcus sp.]
KAFYNCADLESLTLMSTVTDVGKYAFARCKGLKNVEIPSGSVKKLSEGMFSACSSLESITIPNTVTEIGDWAISSCSALESITIPNSITKIGSSAFKGCSSIENITIPNSVQSIGKEAFVSCTALNSITIPSSVKSIEESTFFECTNLKSITIPSSVTSIGSGAFLRCSSLDNVVIPSGVKSIEKSTFLECSSLKNITIPSSVTSIGDYAFAKCSSLNGFTIPNGVKSVGEYAFIGCDGMESVSIPKSVESIGLGAFNKCTKLGSINVAADNSKFKSVNGNLYDKTGAALIQYAIGKTDNEFTIPDNVTTVRSGAFSYCTNLHSLTIPDSVVTLDETGFYGCANLTELTVSGNGGFDYNSLPKETVTDLTITGNTIRKNVFKDFTALKSVVIPEEITSIGENAFDGCTSLTDLTVSGNGEFNYANLPKTAVKNLTVRGDLIKEGAFSGFTALENATVFSSVQRIEENAFSGCSNLYKLYVRSRLTTIDNNAFRSCPFFKIFAYNGSYAELYARRNSNIGFSYLMATEYDDGEYVYLIGDSDAVMCHASYSWDDAPEELTFPSCVTYNGRVYPVIGAGDFDDDNDQSVFAFSWFESATIPEGIQTIGWCAFYDSSITSVSLPSTLTTIYDYAFEDCWVSNVTIPENVTYIGEGAFYSNSKLKDVTIYSMDAYFGEYVFDDCDDELTIHGYEGSTAEAYADENGFNFVKLSGPAPGPEPQPEPDPTYNYTVSYTYVDYDNVSKTITRTVENSLLTDAELIASLNDPSGKLMDPNYSYSIGDVVQDGTTINVTLNRTQHKFTVSLNGEEYGKFNYLDEVTVNSPDNETTGFLIDGKLVKYGKSCTAYVTGDMDITTDSSAVGENAASLNLVGTYVNDEHLSLELLSTANVSGFRRMGVAYALAEKDRETLAEAVNNVSADKKVYNKIAVHFSDVDYPNKSGQYQFRFAPYMACGSIPEGKSLYFYTFVETDSGIVFSDAVPVAVSHLIA